MNGIIDIGNTRVKWAVFDGNDLLAEGVLNDGWKEAELLHRKYGTAEWLISSVKETNEAGKIPFPHSFLNEKTPLPVVNTYADPAALGKDRIAAVCGAAALFPGRNILVIDAGTCITFDFVDTDKVYHGGSISPGISMRLEAMHHFTAKLPLLSFEETDFFTGKDTRSSMLTGVKQGVLGEAERQISLYSSKYSQLKVVICGGNSGFFEKSLKMDIFVASNLVLSGLNNILLYKQSLHA
jgi:type III pantothenate kinase